MTRPASLVLATALVLVLPTAAPAFTGSWVTAPEDGTYHLADDSPSPDVTIAGEVDGAVPSDKADVVCFNGQSAFGLLREDVDVASGSFSFTIERNDLRAGTCRLLAIPANDQPHMIDLSPYSGPTLVTDYRETDRTPSGDASPDVPYDFFLSQQQARGYADFFSVGSCGVCDMQLFDGATRTASEFVFWGNAYLPEQLGAPHNRSTIQIDGRNAWPSYGAARLDLDITDAGYTSASSQMTGAPALAWSAAGGRGEAVSYEEASDVVVCSGPGGWPVTKINCGNWAPSGVRHKRRTQYVREGTLALVEDEFSSTNGQQHALDLLWVQDFRNPPGAGEAGHQFPWVNDTYATRSSGEEIAPPPGPGPASVFLKTDVAKPDGDFSWPQGVFLIEPPTGTLRFFNPYRLIVPMKRTIPATGSVRIRHAFAIATTRAELAGVASEVTDLYTPPTVAFAAPDEGATFTQSPVVDVSGTAGDDKGPPPVTLNGQPVTVADDGTWTARVTLSAGENTLEATARDAAGNQASATRRLTYAPPPLPPPPVDRLAPAITGLAMTNRTFAVARGATAVATRRKTARAAAAKRGTTVRYSLSEAATVTFAITRARPGRRSRGRCRAPTRRLRKRPRCTRYVRAGPALRRSSPAGRSTLRFTGRIGRRALRRGRHRMAIVATDAAGNPSAPRRLSFRIVRR